MNNRFDDTNWGKHGNPNRDSWYRYQRNYQRLDIDSNITYNLRTNPWIVLWIIIFLILLGGFSDTARGIVFYGINITENWYAGVDSMLDALGAPKLP
jgi:hypothetical protein